MLKRWQENTSSQIISLDILISFANELCDFIEHVESSKISMGILNLELAASPVLATQMTIPPSDLTLAAMTLRN